MRRYHMIWTEPHSIRQNQAFVIAESMQDAYAIIKEITSSSTYVSRCRYVEETQDSWKRRVSKTLTSYQYQHLQELNTCGCAYEYPQGLGKHV